jgi:hypothetical protein
MEEYLMAVNPALWTIVNRGITFPSGDAMLTQDQANEIQRNYQAIRIIKSSLTSEEYDKVDGLKSAKDVWDTLFINHEGRKQVREGRIRALESELNRFVIKDDESPRDMYLRSHVPGTLGTGYGNVERGISFCQIMVRRGYTYFVSSNLRWNTFQV